MIVNTDTGDEYISDIASVGPVFKEEEAALKWLNDNKKDLYWEIREVDFYCD